MGSGISDIYTGTNGGSQPYAPSYQVTPDMLQYDKNRGVYHDGHYDKNPTARNINDSINGDYIENKQYSDQNLTYAIDMQGNIIIGKRNGNGRDGIATPHPTLIGGKNPEVQVAGILDIRGGKIYSYDNQSGHFKPNAKSLEAADKAFGKLPRKLFHKDFKGGKNK